MSKQVRRACLAFTLILSALMLTTSIQADTTYYNIELLPTGTLSGTATLSGAGVHGGIFVYVSGTNMVAVTDAAGNYAIVGVPVGTYTLSFSRPGYADENLTNINISNPGQVLNLSSVVLSPQSAALDAVFGYAMKLYTYDLFDSSITVLRTVISTDPAGPYAAAAQHRVGLAFGNLELNDSAVANFDLVISNYSGDSIIPVSYYWRGVYKSGSGDYAGARDDFLTVVNSYPSSAIADRAQLRLGGTYEDLMSPTDARAAYLALETNYPSSPSVPQAIYNAGWLYYTADVYDSAVVQFDKLLSSYPSTVDAAKASFYKGLCYYNQEDFDQALTSLNASIANYPAGPKISDAWYYRAHCKYNLESYTFAQAKVDYQYLITNFPNSDNTPHAKYYLGNCEYSQSNGGNAIAHYIDFINSEPNNDWVPNAIYKIANAYYFIDADYANAKTYFVNYYTSYSNDKKAGEAHYWAGRCWEKLNGSTDNADAHGEYCTVITQYPNCSRYEDAITRRDIVGLASCP